MITGAIRVALYAEGSGETSGTPHPQVAQGELIRTDHLGAGHALLARIIATARSLPLDRVPWLRPLRLPGREPRGCDLLNPKVLRRVLNWPQMARAPHCSIVLVDDDGDPTKVHDTQAEVAQASPAACVLIASRSFESWLLADHDGL